MNMYSFKRGDIALILVVGTISALFIIWNTYIYDKNGGLTAHIIQEGHVIREIHLEHLRESEEIYLNNHGIEQVIRAEKGQIRFVESNCPDRTCVTTGWLRKTGGRAVCLPSKTMIKMIGEPRQMDSISF